MITPTLNQPSPETGPAPAALTVALPTLAGPSTSDKPPPAEGLHSGQDCLPPATLAALTPLTDPPSQALIPVHHGPIATTNQPVPINQTPPPDRKKPLGLGFAVGAIEVRTSAQDIELQECEAIVRAGWGHFARVGEALLRIRDKQLYKNEYGSFETYCRERWGFGHSQLWRYVSAAEVHQTLALIPGMPMPDCEAQVRPLAGLRPELAQEAWLKAVSWSRDGHVSGLWVQRAVRQVLKSQQPALAAKLSADKQQRYRLRQSVRTGFQDLLTLLFGDAKRDALIAKVQEIERLLDPILRPQKRAR
jgi:hypothetical protein